MEQVTLNFNNGFDARDVWIEPTILHQYEEEFIETFAQKSEWYSIEQLSGNILFEDRTYGDIATFAKNLPPASLLEANIIACNPDLGFVKEAGVFSTQPLPTHSRFTRFTWISLFQCMFKQNYESIESRIQQAKQVLTKSAIPTYSYTTYERDCVNVIYLSFYQACYDDVTVYAVPIDHAISYNLGDYDGREISRYHTLWNELAPYKAHTDATYDHENGCVDAPFKMIHVVNFD